MKSLLNLGNHPSGIPLVADDVLEFHAARVLLLLETCGRHGRIEGLTKFAKLDFFVRYPSFFSDVTKSAISQEQHVVESSMVRHHYGPWDPRYYHVLAYLVSRDLVATCKHSNRYDIELTEDGKMMALQMVESDQFAELLAHMEDVGKHMGGLTGSKLKSMIYERFDKEVAQLPRGEVI